MAGPIVISIITNAARANRDLGQTTTVLGKVGGAARRAAVPAAGALGAIGAAAKQTIDAASDVAEAVSKNSVIFGRQASEIESFADRASSALGQSKVQALDAASSFGVIAQKAGLGGPAAADFAKQFTTLASDMASFGNTTPEEAIVALSAALRGESEPIRRYGVLLDDATLRAKALKLGLVKTTSEALTPSQKALAASKVILEQTTQAQGDFARTSDGAANKSRILTAQQENLKAQLGQQLLPVYEKLLTILTKVLGFIQKHQTEVKIAAVVVAGLAATVLTVNAAMSAYRAVTVIATGVTKLFSLALATSPIGLFVVAVVGLVAVLVVLYKKSETVRNIINAVGRVIAAIPEKVGAFITGAADKISGLYDTVTGAIGDAASWLFNAGRDVIQGFIDGIGDMFGSVQTKLGDLTDKLTSWKGPPEKDRRILRPAGRMVIDGFINGIRDGSEGVQRILERVTGRLSKQALRGLRDEFSRLRTIGRDQDALTASLERQRSKLAELRDTAADYADSIRDSVVDFGSVLNLGQGAGFANAAQLVQQLRARADQADKYAAILARLEDRGLNRTTLEQLRREGVEGGLGTAQTILSGGPSSVAQINQLTRRLQRTGQAMGDAAANSLYAAGVEQAESVITGIEARQARLNRTAREMAREFTAAVAAAMAQDAAREAAREARQQRREYREALRDARDDGKITAREQRYLDRLAAAIPSEFHFTADETTDLQFGKRVRRGLNATEGIYSRRRAGSSS